jgi:hypothetical protein
MKHGLKLLWVALSSISFYASAGMDRLSTVEESYTAGTLFVDKFDYSDLYANSKSRSLDITLVRGTPDRDLVKYTALVDGVYSYGTALIYYIDYTKPIRIKHFEIYRGNLPPSTGFVGIGVDPLVAANVADIGTTSIGLTGGLVEANPLGFGGVIAAKTALQAYLSRVDYEECVSIRVNVTPVIAGAVGWNLAAIFGAAIPVGLLAGTLLYTASSDAVYKDAVMRCLEL